MNDVDEKVKAVAAMLFFLGVSYGEGGSCLRCDGEIDKRLEPKRLYEALWKIGVDPRAAEQEMLESGRRRSFKLKENSFSCITTKEFIEVISKLL